MSVTDLSCCFVIATAAGESVVDSAAGVGVGPGFRTLFDSLEQSALVHSN